MGDGPELNFPITKAMVRKAGVQFFGGLLIAAISVSLTWGYAQHGANQALVKEFSAKVASMETKIEDHGKRLESVEQRGSSALTAHIQSDDVRVEELSRRVAGLEAQREELTKTMNVIATDLRVLISKVEGLTLELKKHEDDSTRKGG